MAKTVEPAIKLRGVKGLRWGVIPVYACCLLGLGLGVWDSKLQVKSSQATCWCLVGNKGERTRRVILGKYTSHSLNS